MSCPRDRVAPSGRLEPVEQFDELGKREAALARRFRLDDRRRNVDSLETEHEIAASEILAAQRSRAVRRDVQFEAAGFGERLW